MVSAADRIEGNGPRDDPEVVGISFTPFAAAADLKSSRVWANAEEQSMNKNRGNSAKRAARTSQKSPLRVFIIASV